MSAERAQAYLWDAYRAGQAIQRFTANKAYSDYEQDELLRSATERQFEILGEAFSNLRRHDSALAERIPDLRQAIAFRNVIAHRYADVDARLVWSMVIEKLPSLVATLSCLLAEDGSP